MKTERGKSLFRQKKSQLSQKAEKGKSLMKKMVMNLIHLETMDKSGD
jgi:hypothetical protein